MTMLTDTLFETDSSEPVVTEGLSPCDLMRLRAVEGWLKLGDPQEALRELDGLGECTRAHPVALMGRAHVHAALGWNDTALALARVVCEVQPHFPAAWICQANILNEIKGLQPAKELLLGVVGQFSGDAFIAYRLAGLSAQLGQMGEAARWLLRAFDNDTTVELKLKAIQDPDLDVLWKKILESIDSFEVAGLTKLAALSQYPA